MKPKLIGPPKDMKKALKVSNGRNQMNFPAIKKAKVSPTAAPYNHFYSFYNHKLQNQRSKNDSKGEFRGKFISGNGKMQYYTLS